MNKATDATGGERTRAPKSERQGSAVSKSRARAFGRDEAAKATNPASDTPKKPARKGALWDAEEAAAVRAEQKRAFIRSVQGLCGHIGGSQLPKPNPVDDLIEHINANHFDEIQREFNDAVQCLRGARAGYFVSSTSNDTFEKLIRGCNEQLGLLIDGRKAALREAPATNSNAIVEKRRKPSYKKKDRNQPRLLTRGKDEGAMKALNEYFNKRKIPDALRPDLTAQYELLAAEALVRAKALEKGQAPIKPPLPDLTPEQIEAVIQRGKDKPWSGRDLTRMNTFEWVRDNYKEWAGKGLLQAHIKAADPELYQTFAKQIERKKGLPEWLDVPSEDEARLRKVTDPEKLQEILAVRELNKRRMQITRAACHP